VRARPAAAVLALLHCGGAALSRRERRALARRATRWLARALLRVARAWRLVSNGVAHKDLVSEPLRLN